MLVLQDPLDSPVTLNSPFCGYSLPACLACSWCGHLQQMLLHLEGCVGLAALAQSGSCRCHVQSLGLRLGGLKEEPLLISWTDPGHTVNLSSSQWFGGYFCFRIVTPIKALTPSQ